MNRKFCLIVGGVMVVAAFLLGFVPQYLKNRNLDSQLGAVRQQLNLEQDKTQNDRLGLLCGHVYLETNLKNYGLASQYSSEFFDLAGALMSHAPASNRQAFLQEVLDQRDSVTGELAKGDPSSVSTVQDLFRKSLDNAQNESK